MLNYEGTVLFYLVSSMDEEKDVFLLHSSALKTIINDARVFDDADQCADQLSSIVDETIFLVLGHGQSQLVDIFTNFSYLKYIYLCQPHHYENAADQVRGVFSHPKQLLQQLEKDVKTTINTDTHLCLFRDGDLKRSHTSLQTLQDNQRRVTYLHEIFNHLLRASKPAKNIHQDLIYECRLVCTNQIQSVNEFEREYQSDKAIWWYTRNSFIYKMVNMALRTMNIVIIWKFRFFIQDLYYQLEKMDQEQRSSQHRRLIVYRGQRISSRELEQINASIGGLMAMTSFVSTTKRRRVAEGYAGAGEGRPHFESVIFEIVINENELDDRRLPFADINDVSYFGEEDEVLLCMGTVLCIESVVSAGEVIQVRLHMCQYDYSSMRNEIEPTLESFFGNESMENRSLILLGGSLIAMGEFEWAQQLFQQTKLTATIVWVSLLQNVIRMKRMAPVGSEDTWLIEKLFVEFRTFGRGCVQYLKSLLEPYGSDASRRTLDILLNQLHNSTVTDRSFLNRQLSDVLGELEELPQINDNQLLFCKILIEFIPIIFADNLLQVIEILSQLKWLKDIIQHENDDHDQAIDSLKEVVPLLSSHWDRAQSYKEMITIHEKKKNWSAVIECCQSIINLSQLPPNSIHIFSAHLRCANAYLELKDESEAMISYATASDLLDQHHRSNPSLLGEYYLKMADGFLKMNDVKSALKMYHQAIENSCPEITSEAYLDIGRIYYNEKNYDLARENLIKCVHLQEAQTNLCVRSWSLSAYVLLIKLEHETGHHQQRDAYVNEALEMCGNCIPFSDILEKNIQFIFDQETTAIE